VPRLVKVCLRAHINTYGCELKLFVQEQGVRDESENSSDKFTANT
jgi:hypothetical protein